MLGGARGEPRGVREELAGLCRQPRVLAGLWYSPRCFPSCRVLPKSELVLDSQLLGTSLLICVVTLNHVNLQHPEYPEAGISLLAPCRAAGSSAPMKEGTALLPWGFPALLELSSHPRVSQWRG